MYHYIVAFGEVEGFDSCLRVMCFCALLLTPLLLPSTILYIISTRSTVCESELRLEPFSLLSQRYLQTCWLEMDAREGAQALMPVNNSMRQSHSEDSSYLRGPNLFSSDWLTAPCTEFISADQLVAAAAVLIKAPAMFAVLLYTNVLLCRLPTGIRLL